MVPVEVYFDFPAQEQLKATDIIGGTSLTSFHPQAVLGVGALLARERTKQRRGLAEFHSQNDLCFRDSADTSALSTALSTRSCAKHGRGKHQDVADSDVTYTSALDNNPTCQTIAQA